MPNRWPRLLWHYAINEQHWNVTAYNFLEQAHKAQARVLMTLSPHHSRNFVHWARLLQVSCVPLRETPFSLLSQHISEQWIIAHALDYRELWWIHEGIWTDDWREFTNPPTVLFCSCCESAGSIDPPLPPWGYDYYVNGSRLAVPR
ncbi:MAG: hypothetical protein C7B46_04705 [Sulfobacillus benefaciens]|uniref:Uncharacterized protein n=1 Tax=Sulfobacillus benefaciens TaxID=453960 RepID=A0A2T2XJZ1_9FIRM|nr:MAG: hypothetical protein C7B46_04705 [Sulfobacillus benefaciens]